jgi:hypothetical protein
LLTSNVEAFALSDDMFLGMPFAASDIFSPLFGPNLGFKRDKYNTVKPPTSEDAEAFGEKPYLIYSSWLMNKRFGKRSRRAHAHFGHPISRDVMREALSSFPGPLAESMSKRFRREGGLQMSGWFTAFHYTIERHREALLWSYVMLRSDANRDGYLDWSERQTIITELKEGIVNEATPNFRQEVFYHVPRLSAKVGLEPPKSNVDIAWTSLDGPEAIKECNPKKFDINNCLGDGFSSSRLDEPGGNSNFSVAIVFERLAREKPECGDCFLKYLLHRANKGLSPLLPHSATQAAERTMALKALMRYKYTIFDSKALFVMVKTPDQAQAVLFDRFIDRSATASQLCLNDDVMADDVESTQKVGDIISRFLGTLFPERSSFEIAD